MGTYTELIKQKTQAPAASAVQPKPINKKIKPTQKTTQISKKLSSFLSNTPTTEEVEKLSFQLRKVSKVRVNADIPHEWKDQLDDLAHKLRVGKYELMLYLIALLLGKVEPQERTDKT